MATEFVIVDRAACERLRTDRKLKKAIGRIRLGDLHDLPDAERLERRINRSYFSCGCKSGAVAVYLAVFVIGLSWWTVPDLVSWGLWKGTLAVVLAGLAGKLIGLGSSRRRLNRALDQVEAALPDSAA